MKLDIIINIHKGMTELKDRKPNIALGYKIAKNLFATEQAVKIFKMLENEILEEHIDKDKTAELSRDERESGGVVIKDARNYEKKMGELNNMEHKVDLETITLEELEENFGNLTPDILYKILPTIKN